MRNDDSDLFSQHPHATLRHELLSIREASKWASDLLKRDISESNITYLIQYGKIRRILSGSTVCVDKSDLMDYYSAYLGTKELKWKNRLGDDLNWHLSFDNLREKDTTKHVHRLHPYKGKFIPQLVEYFIDQHKDEFKKEIYFNPGDIILDPFCGSGTTLVQAKEMGIHAIGIDVSQFNCLISEAKLGQYDFNAVFRDVAEIIKQVMLFETGHNFINFEEELSKELTSFNENFFPSPSIKVQFDRGELDEDSYATDKQNEFLDIYNKLILKYNLVLSNDSQDNFLDKWYISSIRKEISHVANLINDAKDEKNKKILMIILSRTIRSCRATTHSDLATLKEPQVTTYYCWKHRKICKPLFTIKSWFERYAKDTIHRLQEYELLKSNSISISLRADSRNAEINNLVALADANLSEILNQQKIKGIFSSPPYVGQIDYHEQHAYAYDLFKFPRNDDLEIGPLYKGQSLAAKSSYIDGISDVLNNSKRFFADDYNVLLVANDKYNLYPEIAERAGMTIINQFKRPVLNRTERDKNPYAEIIFHLKEKTR